MVRARKCTKIKFAILFEAAKKERLEKLFDANILATFSWKFVGGCREGLPVEML
jgi:hypothetical protein